jgi:hypothetical protein
MPICSQVSHSWASSGGVTLAIGLSFGWNTEIGMQAIGMSRLHVVDMILHKIPHDFFGH